MILKELFASFGGLDEKKLSLKSGLNIVEGANESGKSTWCAFIRAMLYGIPTSERNSTGYIAEKNRFRPWGGAPMRGIMTLETAGGELTIERRGTAAAPFRELRILNSTGDEIAGFSADTLGEKLIGAGRETFERSAFIGTPALPSGGSELEISISTLVSSGDDGSSYSAAAARLREWKNRLYVNKSNGLIPKLDAEISALKSEILQKFEDSTLLAADLAAIRELETERVSLAAELSIHDAAAERERTRSAEEGFSTAHAERGAAEGELPPGNPSSAKLHELRAVLLSEAQRRSGTARESEQRSELLRLKTELENRLAALPPVYSSPEFEAETSKLRAEAGANGSNASKRLGFILLLAGLLLAIGAFFVLPSPLSYILGGILLTSGTASCLFLNLKIKAQAEKLQVILKSYGGESFADIERMTAEYLSQLEALERISAEISLTLTNSAESAEFLAAKADILEIFGEASPEEILSAIPAALAATTRFESALAAENTARAVLDALGFSVEIVEPAAQSLRFQTREESEAALTDCESRLSSLRRRAALTEGRLDGTDISALNSDLNRAEENRAESQTRLDALILAAELLDKANLKLRERFSPSLNAEASQIFAFLTGGRYDKATLSREFSASAGNGGSGGLLRILELSSGTADQLWLAIRLAICHALLPPDTPLILDDALLTADGDRLGRALEVLLDEAKTRQVILFTCHDRERRALARSETVNFIKI